MTATQTVLVVDDEPMVREVLAQYLTHDGFVVVEAEDGEQASSLATACSPPTKGGRVYPISLHRS